MRRICLREMLDKTPYPFFREALNGRAFKVSGSVIVKNPRNRRHPIQYLCSVVFASRAPGPSSKGSSSSSSIVPHSLVDFRPICKR